MKITKKQQSNQNSKKNLGDNQNSNKEIGSNDINLKNYAVQSKPFNMDLQPSLSVKNQTNLKLAKSNGQSNINFQSHNFNPNPEPELKKLPESKANNHKRVSSEKVDYYNDIFTTNSHLRKVKKIQDDDYREAANRSKSQNNSIISNDKDKKSKPRILGLKNTKLALQKLQNDKKDIKKTLINETSSISRNAMLSPKETHYLSSNKSVDKLNQSFSISTSKKQIADKRNRMILNPSSNNIRASKDNRSSEKPINISNRQQPVGVKTLNSNLSQNNLTLKLDKLKKTLQGKQISQQMNNIDTEETAKSTNLQLQKDIIKNEVMFNGTYPYAISNDKENKNQTDKCTNYTYEKPVFNKKKLLISPSPLNKRISKFNNHKKDSYKLLNEKNRSSSNDEDTPNFENAQTETNDYHFKYDTIKGKSSNGRFEDAEYDTNPVSTKYTRDRSKMFSFGFGLN